jgi:hypothetical protein
MNAQELVKDQVAAREARKQLWLAEQRRRRLDEAVRNVMACSWSPTIHYPTLNRDRVLDWARRHALAIRIEYRRLDAR